jgi:hypothetical protein
MQRKVDVAALNAVAKKEKMLARIRAGESKGVEHGSPRAGQKVK